ncbi:MAG: hypothetical protein VW397_06675 [Candidatus Margulisiibacteriota bacterium]
MFFTVLVSIMLMGFIDDITRSIVDIVAPEHNLERVTPYVIFYNSLNYSLQDVEKGLINTNYVVQFKIGAPETRALFYYSKDHAFEFDSLSDVPVFYDSVADKIYYNLAVIDFLEWKAYEQMVVDINIKRLEYLSESNLILEEQLTSADIKLKKESVTAFINEMSGLVEQKGQSSQPMSEWLTSNAWQPYLLTNTAAAASVTAAIVLD